MLCFMTVSMLLRFNADIVLQYRSNGRAEESVCNRNVPHMINPPEGQYKSADQYTSAYYFTKTTLQ